MDARVAIVINRRAQHLVSDGPVLRAITGAVRSARNYDRTHGSGRTTDVAVHETRSVEELDEVTRELARRGTTRVVLAGGDGSYMAGVTSLARAFGETSLPEIALAPGGTVSTVARNWGARGTMATCASHVVRASILGTGRVDRHPTLRVGDNLGFIFGAGLVATFFDEYYAAPRQGYVGAARIVGRIFAGSFVGSALARRVLTPQPCELIVDGEVRAPRAWSLITASVVQNAGLHMKVTYRAGEEEDRVHVVASPLGPMALGPQMPLVLAGRRLFGRDHLDTLARELIVRFPSEKSYVLDGEILRATEVRVSAGPTLLLRIP